MEQRKDQSNLRQKETFGGCHRPNSSNAGFSYAVSLMDNVLALNENEDKDESEVFVRYIGAKMAACHWFLSKAVKNNRSPAFGWGKEEKISS